MTPVAITFKGLRSFASLSHETRCYRATVYVQGQRVGTIENRGDGGCSHLVLVDRSPEVAALVEQARAFALTQSWTLDSKAYRYQLLEDYIDALVAVEADRRAIEDRCRRMLKGRVLVVVDQKLFEVRAKPSQAVYEALRARHGKDVTILNELPAAEAAAIYVRHATVGDAEETA